VPPIVQAFVPSARFRYDILASTQDPLTILLVQSFVVGQSSTDEPPRQSALSLANQAIVQQAWTPAVTPQAPRQTAAWNIPPVISTLVPFVAQPSAILRAWQDDPARLPRLVTIAPLTLATGQQPPRYSIAVRMAIVLASWPADLEPRLQRPNDQQVKIAPLTLIYGNRPPVQAPLSAASRIAIAAWPLDLEPRLTRPNADRPTGPTWLYVSPFPNAEPEVTVVVQAYVDTVIVPAIITTVIA
jgi:hypothetical protein